VRGFFRKANSDRHYVIISYIHLNFITSFVFIRSIRQIRVLFPLKQQD